MDSFRQYHEGYRIKRIIPQTEAADVLSSMMETGAFAVGNDGIYSSTLPCSSEEFVKEPHCLIVTPEFVRPGTWIGLFFTYQEPRIYFSASEQRLLTVALQGLSDEELAGELCLSLSAVKKTWRMIYDRTRVAAPNLVPDVVENSGNGERGKGKRQRLLAYVRQHPEELRPLPRRARGAAA